MWRKDPHASSIVPAIAVHVPAARTVFATAGMSIHSTPVASRRARADVH